MNKTPVSHGGMLHIELPTSNPVNGAEVIAAGPTTQGLHESPNRIVLARYNSKFVTWVEVFAEDGTSGFSTGHYFDPAYSTNAYRDAVSDFGERVLARVGIYLPKAKTA